MFNLKDTQFAGYDATYVEAQRIEAMCIAKMQAGLSRDEMASSEGDTPRLYSRAGKVGIVTVRGPLINTENQMTAFFGVSTYPAIREAFVFAAGDSEVDTILLDIESGGGQVSGVTDTARLIATVNKVKSVTAYSSDLAASAAYWLASSAGKFLAGELAITGSIGVITTHVSYHDALKKEGVDVTVLRMGKNKALGHPAEKLSDKAEQQILDQMAVVYDAFTAQVAKNRGIDVAKRDVWANGNEFIGADAQVAGLIDGISTADKVYAQLAVDKRKSLNNTQMQNNKRVQVKTPTKSTLSAELLAAAEAGTATAEQIAEIAAAGATAASQEETAAPAATAVEATAATPAVVVEAVEEAAAVKTESEILAFLRSELSARDEKIVALTVEKTALTAKVTEFDESHEALCKIVRNGVNVMSIGLGGSAASLDNLSGKALVEKHAQVAADFTKAFKTGGVAITAPDVEKEDTAQAANVTSMEAARLRMTGLPSK